MKLICAQEDHVARTGQPLSKAFLPIKTSDSLVVELRKWLDHVGHGMPFFTGWNKSKVYRIRRSLFSYVVFRVCMLLSCRRRHTKPSNQYYRSLGPPSAMAGGAPLWFGLRVWYVFVRRTLDTCLTCVCWTITRETLLVRTFGR